MSVANTKIQWCDATWNPIRGCSPVGEGCRNCYAVRQAARHRNGAYKGLVKPTPSGPQWTGDVRLIEKALRWPSTIKTPKKIFVASMSDPFHECLPTGSTKAMFEAMGLAYWHTYMLLTKRPRRAQEKLTNWMDVIDQYRDISDVVILRKNIWPGISCSTQRDFDAARMLFNGAGFHVPWVSLEPLCEPIDISIGRAFRWVVIGGETGPRARPCEIEWIRAIVQQCKEAGMPCFVKQLGGRRHKNDSPDEWPEDLRVREWPDTKK